MLSGRSWKLIERLLHPRATGPSLGATGRTDARSPTRAPVEDQVADQVAVPEVIDQCRGLLEMIARRAVKVAYDAGSSALVPVSREALERILVNLTKNAAEASPRRGAITLRVSCVRQSGGGVTGAVATDRIVLSVEDRGRGMSTAAVKVLMGESRMVPAGPHGIGFRVVRELVGATGGQLRLKSRHADGPSDMNVPSGTTVEITWTVAAGAIDRTKQPAFGTRNRRLTPGGAQQLCREDLMLGADGFGMRREQAGSTAVMSPGSANASGGLAGHSAANYGSRQGVIAEPPGVGEQVPSLQVLVVDDDGSVRAACCEMAAGIGFLVIGAGSVPEARAILKHQAIDLLLLDLKLPGDGGLLLLEEVKALHPETSVVVMTAFATVSSAVEAMRIGAGDYLTKPFALEELTAVLHRAGQRRHFDLESRKLRERLRTEKGMGNLIGRSPEMEKLYRILSKVATSTHPVLILGESGTGKELVARSIHFNGPHAAKPFIPVDCSSLVPTLIESELFGYVKGAFTGANRDKAGLLAAAAGGTVFLDEIGELPLDLQAKLLRALQEKEVRPVGATQAVPISARILAATNRDLIAMVEQGKFRKDLYFRLNVVNIKIPPLRDRRADIAVLALHFLEQLDRERGVAHMFSDETLRLMTEFDWPGNVRELEHAIERACALSSGPMLHMGDLPTQLQDFRMQSQSRVQTIAASGVDDERTDAALVGIPAPGNGGVVSIAEMEKHAILLTIRQLKGDKLMAAKLLGIGKTTLYRKLKEYGIAKESEGS